MYFHSRRIITSTVLANSERPIMTSS